MIFLRHAIAAGLLLAAPVAGQPARQPFSNDRGWAVSLDPSTHQCELSTVFPGDDGQLFVMLVPDGVGGPVRFALAGDAIRGAPGNLSFVFDGTALFAGPVQTYQAQSLGVSLPPSALAAFASASRLEIQLDSRPVARLVLDGSTAAINHLRACTSRAGR